MSLPTCLCGECKKCRQRERTREWRKKNPERQRELTTAFNQRHADERRKKQAKYREENLEKIQARDREYSRTRRPRQKKPPLMQWAHNKVNKAIERGDLVPQPCEACGDFPVAHDGRRAVHAHHDDYSKPLEVRWLCYPCHGKEHRRYTEEPT